MAFIAGRKQSGSLLERLVEQGRTGSRRADNENWPIELISERPPLKQLSEDPETVTFEAEAALLVTMAVGCRQSHLEDQLLQDPFQGNLVRQHELTDRQAR